MRKLQPHEKAQTGDWFYVFGSVTDDGWVQLSDLPMPFKEQPLGELQNPKNFPIVIMRPTPEELEKGTRPTVRPNQHRMRKTGSEF